MRETSLCSQKPKKQCVPTLPHHPAVSQQLLLFSTVYLQPGSSFISRERCSGPLCTLPFPSVYHLGLWLTTTLPCLPCFTGGKFQAASHDTQLAIGCGASCLHFPLCPFVVRYHQAKSNDSPLGLDLSFLYVIANPSGLCNVFTTACNKHAPLC